MQTRQAERVFPLPVGAEMRVASPARRLGQPCSCGSVVGPNLLINHSARSDRVPAGVGGGAAEAELPHDREGDDVVAYVGELVDGVAGLGQDFVDRMHLVGLALVDEL